MYRKDIEMEDFMIENILIVVFTVLMLVGSILGWRLERSEPEKKGKKEK